MTLNEFIFKSIIEHYKIDIVCYGLQALYMWTWFIRKITLAIDFCLCMLMLLPETCIVVNKPILINSEQQKIKIVSAINQSNEIITNKLNLFLRRYWNTEENNFNINKFKEFLNISVLLITYLIMSEGDKSAELNRIKTVIIEVKGDPPRVYQDNAEAPFGDVSFH